MAYDQATDSFDIYMQNQGMADIQVAFAQVTNSVTNSATDSAATS